MRIRTGYSFRIAVGHLPDVVARIKDIGWKVAPISDRCSTFGFNRFTKECKRIQLRPIYGVELAVATRMGDKKPVLDYWIFFAKKSLRPLHDLIARATGNTGHEPSLTYKEALEAEGIIKIAGERLQLDELLTIKDRKDFYVGLSPATPKALVKEVLKNKLQFIACGNNVYPNATDQEFYRVTMGKRADTQTYPQHILSDKEWREACDWFVDKKTIDAAIKNRDAAFKACQADMKKATLLVPEKPKTLRQLCIEGAKRTKTNLKDPIYKERLDRELNLIAEKKFEDYFFVIADMVNYAKKKMIVGPARGSSCGSLVCYLLNITAIDPIPFGLIFERFIDTTRTDLPDIDIDFSDDRRHFVFEYAEEKYGKNRVARLGTVGMFKPRSALNQAGIALQIPKWMVEKVLDGVIERSSGDARAMLALEDTLNDTEAGRKMLNDYPEVRIAARMEGHPNNASQHAAGIVVTQEPLAEYVAIDTRTKAAMVDKKDAEDLNLLKIDALGLTQLSIFERTLELIGKKSISGYLETLPIDNKSAFDVLNKGHFAGIFQFTGSALQSLVKQIEVTHIEDMISITALARPGPLATGGANSWVKRKTGREEVTSLHPMLTELTKETYGIVIYQEQVMNVVRKMGLFSWEDTSAIRKAMSGRLGDEFFARYRLNFLKGAKANSIDEQLADEVWRHINTMGSWAFNRSHAVAYGFVSYWCCWLKAHHPIEFAAATLDAETDPAKQIVLLRELRDEGVDYIPVDPQTSINKWTVKEKEDGGKILVGPLTTIKGIGPAAVMEITDARKAREPVRPALLKRLQAAKTEIDTLYPIADAVERLWPNLTDILRAESVQIRQPLKLIQCGVTGEVMAIAVARRIAPRDENDPANIEKRIARRGNGADGWDGKLKGPTMALNLFLYDDTDEIFAKIDRRLFEEHGRPIVERGKAGRAIYAVKGTVPRDFRMISVNNIRYLGDLDGERE